MRANQTQQTNTPQTRFLEVEKAKVKKIRILYTPQINKPIYSAYHAFWFYAHLHAQLSREERTLEVLLGEVEVYSF